MYSSIEVEKMNNNYFSIVVVLPKFFLLPNVIFVRTLLQCHHLRVKVGRSWIDFHLFNSRHKHLNALSQQSVSFIRICRIIRFIGTKTSVTSIILHRNYEKDSYVIRFLWILHHITHSISETMSYSCYTLQSDKTRTSLHSRYEIIAVFVPQSILFDTLRPLVHPFHLHHCTFEKQEALIKVSIQTLGLFFRKLVEKSVATDQPVFSSYFSRLKNEVEGARYWTEELCIRRIQILTSLVQVLSETWLHRVKP